MTYHWRYSFLHIAMFDEGEILNLQTSFDVMGYPTGVILHLVRLANRRKKCRLVQFTVQLNVTIDSKMLNFQFQRNTNIEKWQIIYI